MGAVSTQKEMLDLVRSIDRKQDRLIERLFGDLDNENPEARFPRLEANLVDNQERLQELENDRIRLHTLTAVISTVIGYFLSFFVNPFKH